MGRSLKVVAQLGALALVLGLLGLLAWKLTSDERPVARVGEPLPSFDLPQLGDDAARVSSAQFRGQPLVINFWATWCGPCRDEAPLLERVWRKYRDRGVVVIGVDIRDFTGDALAFAKRYDVTYPLAYDGPGRLWEPWGLSGLPETFFVDRAGVIVEHRVGPYETERELVAAIERALA